ncbi:MAG: undecaprenyldiphospho-muramoylpentapeptide beta-N-acetylglucosaminyltransferase [Pseudomonadota bacterium]
MNKPTIIISAGGTGGHIFPALAVAKQLQSNYQIIWVGGKIGLENQIVPQHGFNLRTVNMTAVRNKGLWRKLSLPFTLIRSIVDCRKILADYKVVAVIGFGGYATVPIIFAARLGNIPTLIHEQNAIAGLSNKLLSYLVTHILVAFPQVLTSKKTSLVGNPVRQEILNLTTLPATEKNLLRILVVGGSLGAKILNDIIPQALSLIADKIAYVCHQVGRGEVSEVEQSYQQRGINAKIVKFIDNMAEAYANADVVICRAGASTVAEISCAAKCAIFIPYPWAVDDHQTANAQYLVQAGGGIIIQQKQLTATNLANQLSQLNVEHCYQIGQQAHHLALKNATIKICQIVQQLS